MSDVTLIPDEFFIERLTAEDALHMLEPIITRAEIRADLVRELVAVERRVHPGSLRMIAAVQARVDAIPERERLDAGFLPFAVIDNCEWAQRNAAIRALARFLPDEDAFQILWDQVVSPESKARDSSIRAIADNLPHHADVLLAAVRAPYEWRPLGGKLTGTYPVTTPKTMASFALVVGIGRCGPELQAEIRRTVRFVYDGPADQDWKYSDEPDCRVRNDLITRLATPFWTGDHGDPALAAVIHDAVGEHFLDDFLAVFTDHGSVNTEAVALAMAWRTDSRVTDALAGYLEAWGGTFLSESETCQLIWAMGHWKDAVLTERFVRSIDLLERKPMDEDLGPVSARRIREAIATWRKERAQDIAALVAT